MYVLVNTFVFCCMMVVATIVSSKFVNSTIEFAKFKINIRASLILTIDSLAIRVARHPRSSQHVDNLYCPLLSCFELDSDFYG